MTHVGLAIAAGDGHRGTPRFARPKVVCLLCLGLALSATSAPAEVVYVQKDFAEMGRVPNVSPGICAAAANINSLVYLRNHFPGIYADTDLIPDWDGNGAVEFSDQVTSRDKMAYGWDNDEGVHRPGIYGSSAPGGGGTAQAVWEATYWWFEDFAPGTSAFDGQVQASTTGWHDWEVLERGYPQWAFLWDSLLDAADVELGIYPTIPAGAHAVTLIGLAFDDLDGDGWWDAGEEPKEIGYLDPNSVSAPTWSDVTINPEVGRIEFQWSQTTYYIDRAFTKGPVLIPGDANADGIVDLLDLGIVGDNWNGTGKVWETGDFNDDGVVDLLDLGIVGDNWNVTVESAVPSPVPEPAALTLLLGTIPILYLFRRRRSFGAGGPWLSRRLADGSGP